MQPCALAKTLVLLFSLALGTASAVRGEGVGLHAEKMDKHTGLKMLQGVGCLEVFCRQRSCCFLAQGLCRPTNCPHCLHGILRL